MSQIPIDGGLLTPRLVLTSSEFPCYAETDLVDPIVRWQPVTYSGTKVLRIVIPRPAAKDTGCAAIGARARRTICRGAGIVRQVAVLYPFPDIAVHIVQSPGVCRIASDLGGLSNSLLAG